MKKAKNNCSATLLFKMHQRAATQNSSLCCCLSWWGTLRAAGFCFSGGKVPPQNNYQIGSCCELGVPPASGSFFPPNKPKTQTANSAIVTSLPSVHHHQSEIWLLLPRTPVVAVQNNNSTPDVLLLTVGRHKQTLRHRVQHPAARCLTVYRVTLITLLILTPQ